MSQEGTKKGTESLCKEIMAKKVPNLGRKMDIQIHGVQKIPKRISSTRSTIKHIKIKLSKVRNRNKLENRNKKGNW